MKTLQNPTIAQSLRDEGYGFIRFTPPDDLIPSVMDGWRRYLQIPKKERLKWQVGNPRDWDDGYVGREGGEHDHKDFFHYRPHLYALLENAEVDYTAHANWLMDMDRLWYYCHQRFQQVVRELDEALPGFSFTKRFFSPVARSRHVVRLLSYNRDLQPGVQLGKSHVDRNFGTFQVFETHPALVLELSGEQVNYHPKHDHVLVFTGGKAEVLTDGKLKGIKHVVIVPQDIVKKGNEPRQSIVFFAHVST